MSITGKNNTTFNKSDCYNTHINKSDYFIGALLISQQICEYPPQTGFYQCAEKKPSKLGVKAHLK